MEPNTGVYDITLLYVEDETSTREHLTFMLQHRVKKFLCARNGREGLDLFLLHSPDIVLTDIMMPVMGGLEMADEIRKKSPETQIIVLTALNDTENMLSAIDIGINKFIVKPVLMRNLVSSIESCVEVIKLKQNLKKQSERIQLLSTALEQSPSIVVITDPNGVIEQVNHRFSEMTGYSSEEAIGNTPRILKSGETSREVYDDIWRTVLDGRPWHGVLQNRKKNGQLYWEYSRIYPITLDDGVTTKFIKTAEDITELRKTEEESIRLKQQEAIGILAAGLAHDFNNLLQVIIGNILLAKMHSQPGSKIFDMLDVAEKSSGQASDLSRRLRNLVLSEEKLLHPAPLASLVMTTAKATLKGSNVKLEANLSPDILDIKFNISQMQLVISQLTTNAVEAMPEGGTLRITAENCTLTDKNKLLLVPGKYVHFVFSDTGVGIPPENLSKVFNPYFTTKTMATRKGMGLSLASCHTIIRSHQGTITVESPKSGGASFHIYLPVSSVHL